MLRKNLSILCLLSLTFVTISIFVMDTNTIIVENFIIELKKTNINCAEKCTKIFRELANIEYSITQCKNQELAQILLKKTIICICDKIKSNQSITVNIRKYTKEYESIRKKKFKNINVISKIE